jgi:signal transduction histidine kinase
LLQQTVKLFAPAARSKQLWLGAVCLEEGPAVYLGDNLRLGQMLSNLVGNAIKYTETGGVNITARELSRGNGMAQVEFVVTDTGIGVDESGRALLFEPFSQVEEVLTRRQGGAGLGLAIVRQFAELMDGEVGVESSPGKGSRFWFTVKLAIAGEATASV